MIEERSSGIISRVYPLTETSLIVHWITPELGRLATVAKGARRSKSPFRGKLDLYYKEDFSFLRSRKSELHTLKEIDLVDSHEQLRKDLTWLQQAAYCTALVEQTTETETPIPGIYELIAALLGHLPRQGPQPQTIFAFELKMLQELGLTPHWPAERVSAGARKLLDVLLASDWPAIARLRLSDTQSREIARMLHGFLVYHLEKIPPNRAQALR